MYKGKKILAIVPARGGSKGIPLKNLKKVMNLTLIEHVAKIVKKVPQIDKAIVSSDNKRIINEAHRCGFVVPFIRPDNLSGDKIGDLDVLLHGLKEVEKIDKLKYEVVLMLQPTSPLRTPKIVKDCIKKLINEKLDSVWSITKTDLKYHPLKQIMLQDSGQINYFDKNGDKIIARQQLKPVFHRNGACYAIARNCLIVQKKMMGKKSGSIIVNDPMVSIDTLEDIKLIEKIIKNKKR